MRDDMDPKPEMRDLKKAGMERSFLSTTGTSKAEGMDMPKPVIAEHTVGGGDTLSHIALKYYGHATKPYWMVIYEANKDLIGDDPNKVKRGITLQIPELPPDLKES